MEDLEINPFFPVEAVKNTRFCLVFSLLAAAKKPRRSRSASRRKEGPSSFGLPHEACRAMD
jgi:hypothetical protein